MIVPDNHINHFPTHPAICKDCGEAFQSSSNHPSACQSCRLKANARKQRDYYYRHRERALARQTAAGKARAASARENREARLAALTNDGPPTIFKVLAVGGNSHNEMAFQPIPPESATKAMPGTPEKLAVLCRRVRMGEDLWSEGDRLEWDEEDEDEIGAA